MHTVKSLFVALALAATSVTFAADKAPAPAAPAQVVKGQVLEVKDTDSYTYLRLKTKDGETWAAVGKAPVKKGTEVTIENPMVMTNFESKSLKQKFDRIVLGNLQGTGGAPAAAQGSSPHSGMASAADVGEIKVAKATGPDARTVAEIVSKRTALKDKNVAVRGKVVKFTGGVLGKNWIHLRDGTGTAADKTNDIIVSTKDDAKVGDVVVAKGVVRLDKDLGSGYTYSVMVEDAKLGK
ncbi:MAG TPA: nucleotide-binding protein [Burkholderiales bacterium]|nr:nucleotide-binding protein [Burkholderiales bacterium]